MLTSRWISGADIEDYTSESLALRRNATCKAILRCVFARSARGRGAR